MRFINLIEQYTNKYNVHLIKIINCENRDKILRDGVHTTEFGSEYYANIIFEYFINSVYDKHHDLNLMKTIQPTKYSNIKKFDYDHIITNQLIIQGNCEIIGLFQKIGPYSGLCEIIHNNNKTNSTKYNLWDQWCYFERENIKLNLKVNGVVEINVLRESFDTSSAKEQNTDPNKKIILKSIFYIGDINEITHN